MYVDQIDRIAALPGGEAARKDAIMALLNYSDPGYVADV